jgi:hypothetical protein
MHAVQQSLCAHPYHMRSALSDESRVAQTAIEDGRAQACLNHMKGTLHVTPIC